MNIHEAATIFNKNKRKGRADWQVFEEDNVLYLESLGELYSEEMYSFEEFEAIAIAEKYQAIDRVEELRQNFLKFINSLIWDVNTVPVRHLASVISFQRNRLTSFLFVHTGQLNQQAIDSVEKSATQAATEIASAGRKLLEIAKL